MSLKENAKSNSLIGVLNKVRSSELFWILAFAVLTFLSAQVAVPVQPVPFTLQTMIVLLSGLFLGSKNGTISQIAYILAGAVGIPVYTGFSFGFDRLFGFTGGYLLAFPLAAFVVGYITELKRTNLMVLFAMVAGSLIILLSGALYLSLFMNSDLNKALFSGAIIFSVWDLLKIAAAFSIYKAISKKYPRLP